MIDMQCATLGVMIAYIEGYGSTHVLETSLDSGRRKGVEKSNSGWVIDSSLACSGNVLMAELPHSGSAIACIKADSPHRLATLSIETRKGSVPTAARAGLFASLKGLRRYHFHRGPRKSPLCRGRFLDRTSDRA